MNGIPDRPDGIKWVKKGYKIPPLSEFPGIEDAQIVPYSDAKTPMQPKANMDALHYMRYGVWPGEDEPKQAEQAQAPAFRISPAKVAKVGIVATALYLAFQVLRMLVAEVVAWYNRTDFTPVIVVVFCAGALLFVAKLIMSLKRDDNEPEETTDMQTTCMPEQKGNIIINNNIYNSPRR